MHWWIPLLVYSSMQAMHQVCAVGSGHDDGDWWMLLPVDGLCWLYDDGNEVAMIYWWIGPCKVWKQEDG